MQTTNQKGIVKLTKAQYNTLVTTGSVTDGAGQTFTYQDGYIYCTDEVEYVSFAEPQLLTPAQQAQARANIGAGSGSGGTEVYVNGVLQQTLNFDSDPQTQINAKVPTSRTIAGLNLSQNRTAIELRAALNVEDGAEVNEVNDVEIDDVSCVTGTTAEIRTINGDYNASTNRLATESDIGAISSNFVTTNTAQTVTGKKTFSGDIAVNSQIDMGTGAIKYSYNNINFNLNGTDIYLFASSTFQPNGSTNSNKIDLGGTNRYWKDFYLAGNLTDGTNSISIAGISNKVDKTTDSNKVYGTGQSGQQTTYPIGETADAGSIPIRLSGGKIYVGDPSNDGHATNKKYVDGLSMIPTDTFSSISTPPSPGNDYFVAPSNGVAYIRHKFSGNGWVGFHLMSVQGVDLAYNTQYMSSNNNYGSCYNATFVMKKGQRIRCYEVNNTVWNWGGLTFVPSGV